MFQTCIDLIYLVLLLIYFLDYEISRADGKEFTKRDKAMTVCNVKTHYFLKYL